MLKMLKYLKSSATIIPIIILLLIVQAACDLSLPDYLARIVNVGVQQSGIEYASPEVLRKTEMENLLLFTDDATDKKILSHYTLKEKGSSDADEYPLIKKEPLYLLGDISKKERDNLGNLMSKAELFVYGIESGSKEFKAATTQMKASFPKGALPENATLLDIMKKMSAEQRTGMITKMEEKLAGMPDSIIEQAATSFVKSEYEAVGIDTDHKQMMYILYAGLLMLLLTLAGAVAAIVVTLLSSQVAAKLGMNLRSHVFHKVVGFSNDEFDQFSTASLITRSTNDIQQVQLVSVMILRIAFYAPIVAVGGIYKVFNTNNLMSWIIGVAVLAVLSLMIVLFTFVIPKFKAMQKLIDKLNLVSREILTGLPVIRAFHNMKHEEERFDKTNKELTGTNLFINRSMAIMMPSMMFVMNGIMLLIVWVGAHHIESGKMQVGDMMAFIQYTMQIIFSFIMISMISIMVPRASVSAKRIAEVLDTETMIHDPKSPKQFVSEQKGVLEFQNVSFHYHGAEADVLSEITFTANPGETTAIIGSTGSGKSTLVNLIPRFYDVTGGSILVDGVDIREVTQHNLREKIGFVPQSGILFSGTIESNIKFGNPDATEEEMVRAARIAQAIDFIDEKPSRFGSDVSQGGTNVSGGQKQRLAIARAIAKNPEIYVFDDSFSALDFKTDARLRRALSEEISGATVIIVAQRISTILHADKILVLDEGKVVGCGTHKQLLDTCDVYRQIALSQLTKEELDHE